MRRSEGRININSEDTQCFITCICTDFGDEEISVSDIYITLCPKCGRGYRTEFVLWTYNPDEKDPVYFDDSEWKERMRIDRKKWMKMREEREKEMKKCTKQ